MTIVTQSVRRNDDHVALLINSLVSKKELIKIVGTRQIMFSYY